MLPSLLLLLLAGAAVPSPAAGIPVGCRADYYEVGGANAQAVLASKPLHAALVVDTPAASRPLQHVWKRYQKPSKFMSEATLTPALPLRKK